MRYVLLALLVCVASPVFAQEKERLAATDISIRTILSFKASDAAVQKMLPAGWEASSPTTGSGKGFNLSIFLIDFQMVQDSAGKPLPALPTVVLVIPAKKIGLDATANVVFSGFAAQAGTPGPYGVNSLAKVTVDRRSHADTDGKAIIEESWEAKAVDGSALEIQIQFARGAPDRDKAEGKFYSAAKPEFYRTYRYEQGTDVARSAAAGVDRVTKFSFKASGPKLAPLFDGSEQLISVTSIPWYSRSIYLPVL